MDAPMPSDPSAEEALIDDLVARARVAQVAFEDGADQARYDQAALAVGWAIMQPERNVEMASLAVDHRARQCHRQDDKEPPQNSRPPARYSRHRDAWGFVRK